MERALFWQFSLLGLGPTPSPIQTPIKYLDKRNRGMAVRAMDIRVGENSNIPRAPVLPYPDYRFSYVRLLKTYMPAA